MAATRQDQAMNTTKQQDITEAQSNRLPFGQKPGTNYSGLYDTIYRKAPTIISTNNQSRAEGASKPPGDIQLNESIVRK